MKTQLILLSLLVGAAAMAQVTPAEQQLFAPPGPTNLGRTNIFTSTNNSVFFTNRSAGFNRTPGLTNGLQGFFPNGTPRFNPDNPSAVVPPGGVFPANTGVLPPNSGVLPSGTPGEIPTLPGTPPTAPGVPPQIPVTPPGLPGNTPGLPGTTPGLPGTTPGLPGNDPSLPGGAPPPDSFTVPGTPQPPPAPVQPVPPAQPVPPKAPLRR